MLVYVNKFLHVSDCEGLCVFFSAEGSGARFGLTHFSRRPVAVLPHAAISHSSMASPVLCLLLFHMNKLALRCESL